MRYKVDARTGKQTGQWQLKRRVPGKKYPQPVKKEHWPAGLRADMSVEQARAYIATLNAQQAILADEAKRLGAKSRKEKQQLVECAWLPADLVALFESIEVEPKADKIKSAWKLAQKIIAHINLPPQHWRRVAPRVWQFFESDPKSLDYITRLLWLINEYGGMYAEERGGTYRDIPWPRGKDRVHLAELFLEHGKQKKSRPLTKDALAALKDKLETREWNYVQVLFWWGLRPEEAELLYTPSLQWRIEDNTLVIDQPKLRPLPLHKRMKRIPLWLPEQRALVPIVLAGELARPSSRKARRVFPERTTLYGGRHGFVSYMQQLGQPLAKISSWLGHRFLSTTERYYKDASVVEQPLVAKPKDS